MSDAAVDSAPMGAEVDGGVPPVMPPPAKGSPVYSALVNAPSNTDAFMAHLLRCLQTRSGTDVVLQFVCYSCRLTANILEAFSRNALRQSAQKLVELAFKLPPSTSVVLSSAPAPPAAALMLSIGARLRAVTDLISEARTINRLWGLFGLYFALKRLVVKLRTKKAKTDEASATAVGETHFDTLVAFTQIGLLIAYQIFENMSYLGSKKALGLKPETIGKYGLLSVKCWGSYVGIELARLLLERQRTPVKAKDAAWSTNWRNNFLRNLAWAPITVHWSLGAKGFLSDMGLTILAMYPSTTQMMDLWKETA